MSADLSILDNTFGREFEKFIISLFEKLGYSSTVTNRSKEYGCDMMLQQATIELQFKLLVLNLN